MSMHCICTELDQEQPAVITANINAGGLNMHIVRAGVEMLPVYLSISGYFRK